MSAPAVETEITAAGIPAAASRRRASSRYHGAGVGGVRLLFALMGLVRRPRHSGRRRASAETLRTASNPRLPVTSANARKLGRLAVGGWRKGQGEAAPPF